MFLVMFLVDDIVLAGIFYRIASFESSEERRVLFSRDGGFTIVDGDVFEVGAARMDLGSAQFDSSLNAFAPPVANYFLIYL